MGPSAKRKCVRTAVEKLEDKDDDNEEEEEEDKDSTTSQGPHKKGKASIQANHLEEGWPGQPSPA